MKWIREVGKDYIAYSQGTYYKVNNAVLWRRGSDRIVLRNTWTGKEEDIWIYEPFRTDEKEVEKALKMARGMIDKGVIKTLRPPKESDKNGNYKIENC